MEELTLPASPSGKAGCLSVHFVHCSVADNRLLLRWYDLRRQEAGNEYFRRLKRDGLPNWEDLLRP